MKYLLIKLGIVMSFGIFARAETSIIQTENSAYGAQSQADETTALNFTDKKAYVTLEQMYKDGTGVLFYQVEGFYEGRCFRRYDDTARETLLGITSKVIDRNAGPEFPNDIEFKAALVSPNGNPATKELIEQYMWSHWSDFLLPLSKFSLVQYSETNIQGSLKKHGDYLVSLNAQNRAYKCTKNTFEAVKKFCRGGYIPEGTNMEACYFYKKLK